MKRIRKAFEKKTPLFIPFFMAGHPTLESIADIILSFSEVGADIIEVGVPFSDPIADGPINQMAAEIALKNGTTLNKCLESIKKVRLKKCATPLLLFTYLNPIMAMGIENFAQRAKEAGVDGILIVDLPAEEGEDIFRILADNYLEIVLLASPTSDFTERLELYKKIDPGFIYYISRLGVTGIQEQLSNNLSEEIKKTKHLVSPIPIAVGFGISTAEQAQTVAKSADGVIVGSFLVNELNKGDINTAKVAAQRLSQAIQSV